jgi:hypothetical protein
MKSGTETFSNPVSVEVLLNVLYISFIEIVIISSLSATMTMTIESEMIPSFPQEPKKSEPYIPVREIGHQVNLEMSPLPSGVQTPVAGYSASSQLISSRTNTKDQDPTYDSSQIQTVWHPYGNRFCALAACLTCFGNGMNDSAPGALIASIEK